MSNGPSLSDHAADARQSPSTDVLVERTRAIEQSIAALDRLVNERIDGDAQRVALALGAAKEAIQKAEAATEKRFDAVNAFRQQLADQTKTFVSKDEFGGSLKTAEAERIRVREQLGEVVSRPEFNARTAAVDGRLGSLELSRSALEGKTAGVAPIWSAALAIGGALALFLIERAVIR